jgi:hypothetical protein
VRLPAISGKATQDENLVNQIMRDIEIAKRYGVKMPNNNLSPTTAKLSSNNALGLT